MPRAAISSRRQPLQPRALRTVEAVLDAVTRVLKREGVAKVTTNRIAKIAGVSIGSVYQYFPNKQAIFIALRARHVGQMAALVESKLIESAGGTLEQLMRSVIDAMVEAHALDPTLHDLLLTQLPSGPKDEGQFEKRMENALRLAITARSSEFKAPVQLDKLVFVLAQIIEALAHGVVLRRPESLSLKAAKEEAVTAILAYLREHMRAGVRRSSPR